MKIAIASEKKDLDSQVCSTAGRAPYYLIFENDRLIKTIKNPFAIGGGGASTSVVQMLFNENVDTVICGKFGEKMLDALKEKNMNYQIKTDLAIKQIIEDFIKNDN